MKIFKIFIITFCACLILAFLYVKLFPANYEIEPKDEDYKNLVTFVAQKEGLLTDEKNTEILFKLAAESAFEQMYINENLTFFVFRPEYLGEKESLIRSMHGNGNYYIFRGLENKFELIGKFEGNRYEWDLSGDEIKIKYNYYTSALPEENFLKWDGSGFKDL